MRRHDAAIITLLFFLPLTLFWQQTVGGRTLLPTENLYQYEPYSTDRESVGAPLIPHNHLISDLVLQNYQWKSFILAQAAQGEIPLWNPHNFSGAPFMAAGQQSTLYPLSVLYYLLTLSAAYGWFTVLNLWLAGAFMYGFVRALGVNRLGATVSAITYQLCGMLVASAVHPRIIGAAVWLPLLLQMCEHLLQARPLFGRPANAVWVGIGALALACNITAGHAELTIYTLLIAGYFSAARLLLMLWGTRRLPIRTALWLLAMVALGLGMGSVQLIPLYEFASSNWRA
ncbi:MAG: hypothetical protein H7Y11_14485, partial [Armatimonadetes bacterium]|nr:hypothetical protein [Anaerolineae bacterium]